MDNQKSRYQIARTLRNIILGISLSVVAINCTAQDDLFSDDLQALIDPVNVTYFKNKGFRKLEISHYSISQSDTLLNGKKKSYELINDSIIVEHAMQGKGDSPASRYYKEDRFGNLYIASIKGEKEYPSTYVVKRNLPVVRKSIIGKQYFFYNDQDQLIKTGSDTFDLVSSRPCSMSNFEYQDKKLKKKVNSVYDAGKSNPVTSDTLIFHYNNENLLAGYTITSGSTSALPGEYKIIRKDNHTIEFLQTSRRKLTRYTFN